MNRGRPRHDDVLTPREWEVLDLIEDGLTNEEIAIRLGVSFGTAKYHVSEIMSKLGVTRRRDTVDVARRRPVPILALLASRLAGKAPPLLAVGGLAAIAAVLLSVLLLRNSPGPSEGEDLSQALADFQFGVVSSSEGTRMRDSVHSLEMAMTSKSYFLTKDRLGEVASETEYDLWYEAPQLMRVEVGGRLSIWDGTEFWQFDPERNWAAVVPQDPSRDIFTHGHSYMARWVDDLHAYIEDASLCRTAMLTGEEQFLGRDTYVVELGRKRCDVSYPGSDGLQVLWIDKETGLILKSEQYSLAGELAYVSEVVSIQYNEAIDHELFAFSPPSTTEVEDHRDQPRGVLYADSDIPATEYLSMEGAAEAATFPLLTPGIVPEGFALESVEHHWASEFAKEHQSHADWVLLRYTDDQGNWLQVGQGFPGFYVAMVSGAPEAFTGTVQVDGVEATWIDGWPGGEGWQPGIRTALYWDAGRMGSGWEVSPQGTVTTGSPLSVGLSSNVLTLDELVGVAESLQ